MGAVLADQAKSQNRSTKATKDFFYAFYSLKKNVVFFPSFGSATDGNKTRIVRGNLQEEILKLKQEPGKDISTGGVDIPSQLIALGLVDEYHFVVHPIFAGEGRRLLQGVNLPDQQQLKLAESRIFKSGCVALRYVNQ